MISFVMFAILICCLQADSLFRLTEHIEDYEMVSKENLEGYLWTLRVSIILNTMSATVWPQVVVIDKDGDSWNITSTTWTMTNLGKLKLVLHEEFNRDDPLCQFRVTINEYGKFSNPNQKICFGDDVEASIGLNSIGDIVTKISIGDMSKPCTRAYNKKF